MQTTARNASLPDLVELLQTQSTRKVDVVAPASAIRSVDGVLHIKGAEPVLSDEGVTQADGVYRPTAICDEGIADKVGIPIQYMRRLRSERPDLFDANVNGWLQGRREMVRAVPSGDGGATPPSVQVVRPAIPGDPRSFLVRCFQGDAGSEGIARAFLSDRYAVLDHLDALMAALDGVRATGTEVEILSADLTDRRMVVRIAAPEIKALAPVLLDGYRSPFTGDRGEENPTVFAGLVLSNSETGGGAFTITPRLVIQVCANGMTITKDASRAVHLGGKLEHGVIRWSEDTQARNIDLIKAKTADTVRSFLDVAYMQKVIDDATRAAGQSVATIDEVKVLTKRLLFREDEIDGILGHFIKGGQMTRGGVMQAVTSYAQTVESGDVQFDLEAKALSVLSV